MEVVDELQAGTAGDEEVGQVEKQDEEAIEEDNADDDDEEEDAGLCSFGSLVGT